MLMFQNVKWSLQVRYKADPTTQGMILRFLLHEKFQWNFMWQHNTCLEIFAGLRT